MIQRIQTIWLLAAAGCSIASLLLPFYAGNKENNLYETLTAKSHFLLMVLCVAVMVGSLFSIFLFKNRKRQTLLTGVSFLLQLAAIAFFFYQTGQFKEGTFSLTAVFPLAVPFFLILAIIGIRKDERLVRSMDRLR